MNKADVIRYVAKCANVTQAQARRSIDCYHQAIGGALKQGDDVTLRGFGGFSVRKRKARKGRHPKTGEIIKIPSKKVVRFSAGKRINEILK
jgi:DNA-binding protein HU-beta